MKEFKGLIILGMIVMAINCFSASQIGIAYNNEKLYLSSEVQLVDNSVLLPLRDVTESLGYKVDWNEGTQEIMITKGKTVVMLQINNKEAKVGGESKTLEAAPMKKVVGKSAVTYVPIRFISEAFGIDVKWDSTKRMVYLKGEALKLQETSGQKVATLKEAEAVKYTVDVKSGKLLENGKPITTISFYDKESLIGVDSKTTKNGNHIVIVSETCQGGLTSIGSHTYYIKDGKIIKKSGVVPTIYPIGPGVIYDEKNQVVICDGQIISIYNDQTGTLAAAYDTSKMTRVEKQKEETTYFNIDKIGSNYAIGHMEGKKTYVADFTTNKMTCLLDYITNEEDNFYVYQYDLMLTIDNIHFAKQEGNKLIFKYPSFTEGIDKEIVYTIGQ